MKTHPDHVCIVLWLNETSVFFYLLALRKELLVPQAQKYPIALLTLFTVVYSNTGVV